MREDVGFSEDDKWKHNGRVEWFGEWIVFLNWNSNTFRGYLPDSYVWNSAWFDVSKQLLQVF
jgi:hypothetical protein